MKGRTKKTKKKKKAGRDDGKHMTAWLGEGQGRDGSTELFDHFLQKHKHHNMN